MEETKEPIREDEMDKIVHKEVKIDYHEQLKDLIRNSTHGTKIAICSSISKSASIDALVEAYEQNMGYEFSKGNVVLDEVLLERAAMPFYDAVSKELGVEVSNLSDKQLSQIVSFKINDDPEVFARKMQQISEDGHLVNVHYANENLNIKKETILENNAKENYIFSIASMENARAINDFDKSIKSTGSLSDKSLTNALNTTVENLENSKMELDLKIDLTDTLTNMSQNYDPIEIELIRLCKERKYAERFDKDQISDEINSFLEKHKDKKALYKELMSSPDGNIPEKYINKINEYEKQVATVAALASVNNFLSKGKDNLSLDEQKDIVSRIIAGTVNGAIDLNEHAQVLDVLEQLCPDIDFTDKNGKKDIKAVLKSNEQLKKLKKYLPIGEEKEISTENIDNLLKSIKLKTMRGFNKNKLIELGKVDKNFNKNIIFENAKIGFVRKIGRNKQEKIAEEIINSFFDQKSEDLDVIMDNMGKSSEERFFSGSALRFTATDRNSAESLYENATEKCWIDKKEDYIDLRCASLLKLKQDLEGKENKSRLDEKRLKQTISRLKNFNKQYPDYDYDRIVDPKTMNLKKDAEVAVTEYENYKVMSKILVTFMKGKETVNTPEDYQKLDNKEKKAYLLDTVAALSYKKDKNAENKLIGKFGERRLEIIGGKDNTFIEINPKNGSGYTYKIHYDKILEEYNKYSSHKFKTFEELESYCESNKRMYVAEKLEEYTLLRDEDFIKADGNTRKERVEFIENQKFYITERTKNEKALNITNHETDTRSEEKDSKNSDYNARIDISQIEVSEQNSHREYAEGMTTKDAGAEMESELPAVIKPNLFRRLLNKVKEMFTNDSKEETEQTNIEDSQTSSVSKKETFEEQLKKGTEHVDVTKAIEEMKNNSGNEKSIGNDKVTESAIEDNDISID